MTCSRKRMLPYLIALCGFALAAVPAHGETCASPRIEGTWVVAVTLDGPPPGFPDSFTALETYSRGCGLTTTNDLAAVPRGGQGEWRRQEPGRFHTVIQFLTADEQGPTGSVVVVQALRLTAGGTRYVGEGEAEFFDADGNSLGVASFTSAAIRLRTAVSGPSEPGS